MNAAKKKNITAIAAFALIVFAFVGTTLAWLAMQTGEVTNTFTVGDVNISLYEHTINNVTHATEAETILVDDINDQGTNEYQFVHGLTIQKDPTVTVKGGSAACWLFVKIATSGNHFSGNDTDPIVKWKMADGWKQVDSGNSYFWYRKVEAADIDTDFPVFADNSVRINDIFSEAQFEKINSNPEQTNPRLFIRAGAIQSDNIAVGDSEEEAAKIALGMMPEGFRTVNPLKAYVDANEDSPKFVFSYPSTQTSE